MKKTQDLFGSFFDLQDARLTKLKDPLVQLGEVVDWESFRSLLARIRPTTRKSNAGAPRRDEVMMFKGLVLQQLYGLSDEQLEYQVEDRRSFHCSLPWAQPCGRLTPCTNSPGANLDSMAGPAGVNYTDVVYKSSVLTICQRFPGLDNYHRAPDAKTFRAFREQLVTLSLMDKLFAQFAEQLQALGYRARKGQLVDATLVPAPVQRNTREENATLKSGAVPADWEKDEAKCKRRQKDVEARWTKKHGKSHYGYKNHVNVDNKHKLVRTWAVSPANVHDSQLLDDLLDEGNSSKAIRADSAYRSGEQEQRLREKKYRSHIQRKAQRNKPLTAWEQQGNRTRARVRVRVERVFGAQCATRTKLVRCIGLARSTLAIGMVNLVYNMRRLCYLQGVSAPA